MKKTRQFESGRPARMKASVEPAVCPAKSGGVGFFWGGWRGDWALWLERRPPALLSTVCFAILTAELFHISRLGWGCGLGSREGGREGGLKYLSTAGGKKEANLD